MTEKKIEKICVNNLINGWKAAVAAAATPAPATATTQKKINTNEREKMSNYIETNGTFVFGFYVYMWKGYQFGAQSVKTNKKNSLHSSFSFFTSIFSK